MKRWFCFLLVCWGVVFLLLNPGHQAGVHHQLHASCDGSVNCWREFVPTSIRTLPATSIAFVRSRAGPLKSLVACWALLTPADGIGPPWLDQRWPPGACARPKTCRATGQASSSEERQSTLPPRNSLRSTGRAKTRGFATRFRLARSSCKRIRQYSHQKFGGPEQGAASSQQYVLHAAILSQRYS